MTINISYPPSGGIDTSSPLELTVNSADPALEITQSGSGDALTVTGETAFNGAVFKKYPYGFKKKLVNQVETGIYRRSQSTDVVSNWTPRTSAADNDWFSVCWSPELGLFAAVAGSGVGNRVMTSPDGLTWTTRTSAADNFWFSVCWSSELNLFVAVSNSGTNNRVMTSPNGVTWTSRTSAANNEWYSVCWSSELGLFVAVASTGIGNRVMTSPDGVTWTTRTSAADNSWKSVCWAAELGLFVAVSDSGVGNRVMTSPDGFTWTTRTSAVDNAWRSVCWVPELSLLVAVSNNGTNNRVMTSPDGVTWTSRTSAANSGWLSVCWAAELGLIVAVASENTNKIMSSPDGITWTTRTNPSNSWSSVCWSPELGLFASVAFSGTGNRVMTTPNSGTVSAGIQNFIGEKTFLSPATFTVNSTNSALKITQSGAGNAFLVEDQSTDTTPFVIDTAGKILKNRSISTNFVGVGGESDLQIHGTSVISLSQWSTSTAANPTVTFTKSNNATVGSFGTVTAGHILGTLDFAGSLDAYFLRGAQILSVVESADIVNATLGARIVFRTTLNPGGGTPLDTMRLDSQGFVGINQTAPISQLHIGQTSLVADSGTICIDEKDTTPANPAANSQAKVYMKADKIVIQYNDAGTVKYRYMDLTDTTATWTYSTTAP